MAPDKLYKDYVVPLARKLTPREQSSTDYYRSLREKFHDGPYYSVLDVSSSNAKKGSAARANFDPFHGMPSYAGRYQKKRRTIPKIAGVREYGKLFLSRGVSLLVLLVHSVLTKCFLFRNAIFPARSLADNST